MGTILLGVVVWAILVMGQLKKGAKFWTWQTLFVTGFVAAGSVGAAAVSPRAPQGSLTRDLAIAAFGAAICLVYCITASEKIQREMRFPLATGMCALLIGVGGCFLALDLVEWLNGIAPL